MTSPLGPKYLDVVTAEAVEDLEGPGQGNDTHESGNLGRLELHLVFIQLHETQIKELLEALCVVAQE